VEEAMKKAERKNALSWRQAVGIALLLSMAACAGSGNALGDNFDEGLNCSIPSSEIFNGGPGKDGIPALTNPSMVSAGASGSEYLRDSDRVVGLLLGGEPMAIPLNILWWHEIVNLDVSGSQVAVTHCPLTGSSLVFDRGTLGGAEFGVSGLLYRNNLIMYDRSTQESLWPQMLRRATCGESSGRSLPMVSSLEMTWGGWRSLYPETQVVASATGFSRDYQRYPYGDYARTDNPQVLFPAGSLDGRRPPKERVLGLPGTTGHRAYPFGELASLGSVGVVQGEGHVVFWDGQRQGAMAYHRDLDGVVLAFHVQDGQIRDTGTDSEWRVDGLAVAGPLAGERLTPLPEAYVAYWFAWAAFHAGTEIWRAS
jgi:hypothetical protein